MKVKIRTVFVGLTSQGHKNNSTKDYQRFQERRQLYTSSLASYRPAAEEEEEAEATVGKYITP